MKRTIIILLIAAIAVLPWGPGPVRVLAAVVVRPAPVGGFTPGSAVGGGVAGAAHNPSAGSHVVLPVVGLDTTLKSVSHLSPTLSPAMAGSVPALVAQNPAALKAPGIAAEVETRISPEKNVRRAVGESIADTADTVAKLQEREVDKKSKNAESGRGIGATLARWRSYFDGARKRDSGGVFAREVFSLHRSPLAGLSAANAAAEPPGPGAFEVRFVAEFSRSVASFRKSRRWGPSQWDRLNQAIQRFADGQPSKKIALSKRDPARAAGIWKFKWVNEDLRVFFHYDPKTNALIMLEARDKKELINEGENDYYEFLAENSATMEDRLLTGQSAEALSKNLGPILLREIDGGGNPGSLGLSPRDNNENGISGRDSGSAKPFKKVSFGRNVSGLSPPDLSGRRPLSKYGGSQSIERRRGFFLKTHYVLLAFALSGLVAGFGLLPVAAAAAVLVTDLYWVEKVFGRSHDDGAYAFDTELMGEDSKAYKRFIEGTLRGLVARLGLDAALFPRVVVQNKRGKMGAAMLGRAIDDEATLTIGEGYVDVPAKETAAVLAHELGHLAAGDFGKMRLLRNAIGFTFGMVFLRKLAVYGFLFHLASAFFAPLALGVAAGAAGFAAFVALSPAGARVLMRVREAARSFYGEQNWSLGTLGILGAAGLLFWQFLTDSWMLAMDPASLAVGVLLGLLAVASGAVGLLSGIAVTRQEELRADHFAGWLTERGWMADYFRRSKIAAAARLQRESRESWFAGIKRRLLASHPDYDRRIDELTK